MEGRESMGLHGPGSFGAILQRGVASIPMAAGLHAPTAMRPVASSVVSIASNPHNNRSPGAYAAAAADSATAIVPHRMGMAVGVARGEVQKRKRGRPRKYGPDGSMALALAPLSSATGSFSPLQKRGRGRPPGSGRKQQLAALGEWLAGSAGVGFTPHVITIAAGEDVAAKIMSLSQQGPRAVCILSANGAISNVTLRQPATSGGTVTYEGRFEILSLSGSFLLTENGGTRSRTGGLSISLAGPDGRVVGGGVAGLLMAASPVQVVVGSFIPNGRKSQVRPVNTEPSIGLSQVGNSRGPAVTISTTRAPINESSGARLGGPGSPPLNQTTGSSVGNNVAQQPVQNMASFQPMGWPGSQSMGEGRCNTDINISLPAG